MRFVNRLKHFYLPARRYLPYLPILLLCAATAGRWALGGGESQESPIFPAIAVGFFASASLYAAVFLGRGFFAYGSVGLLFMGAGALAWGSGSVAALALGHRDWTSAIVARDACAWLAALCQHAGVGLLLRPRAIMRRRRAWLAAAYALALGAGAGLAALARSGSLPGFLADGFAGTPARAFVLCTAAAMLAWAAASLRSVKPQSSPFAFWYSLALAAAALAVFGILLEAIPGSGPHWAGRAGEALAAAYMLAAVAASMRSPASWFSEMDEALRPVAAREQREEELRAADRLREAFFAAAPIIMNIVDDDFRFVKTDSITPVYFGLDRQAIVGKALAELSPAFFKRYGEIMREVVATGQPRSGIEIESFAPDNRDEPHFWQMSFFALPLGTDRRGLGIIGLDVTKIKRAEAELRDALRVRDEFLSIASHELKTPLTAIQLSIQNQARMLRAAGSGAPLGRLARSSEILSKEIRRLSALVDNLLDVSRISAGKLMLSPEPTNFSVLVREVLLREMPVLNRAGIKLTLEIEDGIALELDRLRLDQVVTNLVSNAVKYAPGSGLGVCLRRDGETIRLDVCDGGPGLAPGDEIKIFSRFERAAASATSIQGLGLGLYISRQIIEAHGGLITVANGSEIGACFTIALPLQAKGKLV